MTSFHDFDARTMRGRIMPLELYAGNLVVVSVVGTDDFLAPQLSDLESLAREFRESGVVVLGFPTRQFTDAQRSDAEILQACRDRGVTFPVFAPGDVNGPGAAPVWRWLRAQVPGPVGERITHNFTQFLVGRDGSVLARYEPTTPPDRIALEVHSILVAEAAAVRRAAG